MKEIKIISGRNTLSRIVSSEAVKDILHCSNGYDEIFAVYDEAVKVFAGKIISCINTDAGASGRKRLISAFAIQTSENAKNIETVMEICRRLLENNADRNALLLGIGGGITTDIAGFAASIYKRGIRFAFVPTTLLAQVDAAIGGKTGVNFLGYKNMIGVIRQPEFTFECPEALDTLPYRDFVSGSAEMLKTFVIENKDGNYEKAVRVFAEIHNSEDRNTAIRNRRQELMELVNAAAEVKAGVVGRDMFERNERRKLNLGHTFGHAIEKQANSQGSGVDISHGEAVAIGIAIAVKLSERLGICSCKNLSDKIIKDLASCGLPVESPFDIKLLGEAIKKDKKAESGIVHFLLVKDIGEVLVKDLEPDKAIKIIEEDLWFA